MEKKGASGTCSSDNSLGEAFPSLPPKALFRFSCISKARNSSVPKEFVERGLPSPMSGFFINVYNCNGPITMEHKYVPLSARKFEDHCSIREMNLNFLPSHLDVKIIDSCNGLLLCHSVDTYARIYYISNPVTKSWFSLPKPPKRDYYTTSRLTFDPQVSPHYKVIRIVLAGRYRQQLCIILDIFSSDIGKWVEWKLILDPMDYISWFKNQDAIFLNGDLHIPAVPSHILRINVKEESYQLIALPQDYTVSSCLVESRGYLHYVRQCDHELEIWTLKHHSSNEWVLKLNSNLQGLVEKVPHAKCPEERYARVLAFDSESKVAFLETHCKILAYHLLTRKFEVVFSLGCEKRRFGHPRELFLFQAMPNSSKKALYQPQCSSTT